jgi:hypothetical protein
MPAAYLKDVSKYDLRPPPKPVEAERKKDRG